MGKPWTTQRTFFREPRPGSKYYIFIYLYFDRTYMICQEKEDPEASQPKAWIHGWNRKTNCPTWLSRGRLLIQLGEIQYAPFDI